MTSWRVARTHGRTAEFHTADPPPERSAVFHTVERPTLVLGSSQPASDVDARVAAALGAEVVTRRSGGGAVLLLPGEFVWLDLVVPAGDALWSDDVGAAMVWVGELWQRALADVAPGLPTEVHRGALVRDAWSRQVCWTGVGAGEVLAGTAKVVGVSQRRTRTWARLQSMCHLRWRPELVAALVSPPRPTAAELAPRAACVTGDGPGVAATLGAALLTHLPA